MTAQEKQVKRSRREGRKQVACYLDLKAHEKLQKLQARSKRPFGEIISDAILKRPVSAAQDDDPKNDQFETVRVPLDVFGFYYMKGHENGIDPNELVVDTLKLPFLNSQIQKFNEKAKVNTKERTGKVRNFKFSLQTERQADSLVRNLGNAIISASKKIYTLKSVDVECILETTATRYEIEQALMENVKPESHASYAVASLIELT